MDTGTGADCPGSVRSGASISNRANSIKKFNIFVNSN